MILLDTHALVWWADEAETLSSRARRRIDEAIRRGGIAASAMSAWEISMLVKTGRIAFGRDIDSWFGDLEVLPYFRFVSIDVPIAKLAIFLPEPFHKDPADRIIVATALRLGVPLVTNDAKIRAYKHIPTLW